MISYISVVRCVTVFDFPHKYEDPCYDIVVVLDKGEKKVQSTTVSFYRKGS